MRPFLDASDSEDSSKKVVEEPLSELEEDRFFMKPKTKRHAKARGRPTASVRAELQHQAAVQSQAAPRPQAAVHPAADQPQAAFQLQAADQPQAAVQPQTAAQPQAAAKPQALKRKNSKEQILRRPSAASIQTVESQSSDDRPVAHLVADKEPDTQEEAIKIKKRKAANFFDRPSTELTTMAELFPEGIPEGLPAIPSVRFRDKRRIKAITKRRRR